jgi:hypothetical protein
VPPIALDCTTGFPFSATAADLPSGSAHACDVSSYESVTDAVKVGLTMAG